MTSMQKKLDLWVKNDYFCPWLFVSWQKQSNQTGLTPAIGASPDFSARIKKFYRTAIIFLDFQALMGSVDRNNRTHPH